MQTTKDIDIWDFKDTAEFIVIPVNKQIRNDRLVMGKGVALQATKNVPSIRIRFAYALKRNSFNVCYIRHGLSRYVAFPTKVHWREQASLKLIRESAKQLRELIWSSGEPNCMCILPKVGCGYGNLAWEDVEPVLREELPDKNFVVVL